MKIAQNVILAIFSTKGNVMSLFLILLIIVYKITYKVVQWICSKEFVRDVQKIVFRGTESLSMFV